MFVIAATAAAKTPNPIDDHAGVFKSSIRGVGGALTTLVAGEKRRGKTSAETRGQNHERQTKSQTQLRHN